MVETDLSTEERGLVPVHRLPLDRNPAYRYLSTQREGAGRRPQKAALDTIAGILSGEECNHLSFPWWKLRYAHTSHVRSELVERYSSRTVNRMLSALRGVLEECRRLKLMGAEDCRDAQDVRGVKVQTLPPAGREVERNELEGILWHCSVDESPAGARDAAILSLMYQVGLRRSEVVALNIEHFDPEKGRLEIRESKGMKDRAVPVAGGALAALQDWLAERGEEPGPLFWPVFKSGRLRNRRLTAQAVYMMLRRRAEQAGIKEEDLPTPHDLRRTCVGDLLDASADISTVARLVGHSSVDTTARYDRRPEETMRRAVENLDVPYTPRGAGSRKRWQ